MKKNKKNLILLGIVFVLIIGIDYIWNSNMGKTSKQVKETINFLEKLYEIGAIKSEAVPIASDIQEVKTTTNGNSTVAYTLKWHNCGVDLDKNYNVIGFLEQTNTIKDREMMITEKDSIEYAEEYLSHILDDSYEVKEVLENENDNSFYTINFYRYHKKYINYDDIVTVKINKCSGELVGFSALNIDDVDYHSFLLIKELDAKKNAREYLESSGLKGEIIDIKSGYFITSEKNATLSYVMDFKLTSEGNEGKICTIIINGRDGSVVKHSIK